MNKFNEIKRTIDIFKVAEFYGVKLDKHGKGTCPFHSDKTPSFSVNRDKQFFKCFGCGKSGSVLDLVSQIFGLNILEASKKINSDFNCGIDFEEYKPDKEYLLKNEYDNWLEYAKNVFGEFYKELCTTQNQNIEDKVNFYKNNKRLVNLCDQAIDTIWTRRIPKS